MDQAGLRAHERGAFIHKTPPDHAPSRAVHTVALGVMLTHLPLRGQRRDQSGCVVKHALTGFPVSLGQPWVAEHLKQAAKVRGLGVERQLKPVRTDARLSHY